jgi:peptide deformylase
MSDEKAEQKIYGQGAIGLHIDDFALFNTESQKDDTTLNVEPNDRITWGDPKTNVIEIDGNVVPRLSVSDFIKPTAAQNIEDAKKNGLIKYNDKVFTANSIEGLLEKNENGEAVCTNEELAERLNKVIDEAKEKGEDVGKAVADAINDNVVFADSPEALIVTVDGFDPVSLTSAAEGAWIKPDVLRTPGRRVSQENFDEAQGCAEKLYAALRTRPNAVGVAAQQVGYDLAMFLVRIRGQELLVVNPSIQKFSPTRNTTTYYEGCLSIPGKQYAVKRCNVIKLFYLDKYGKKKEKRFKQEEACIIQHEYDHTRGILISDIGQVVESPLNRIVSI